MRSLFLCVLVLQGCATPPRPTVRFETDIGSFTVEVAGDRAPLTAANFLRYVDERQYDGGRFHRAVRLDNQRRKDVLIEVVQAGASRDRRVDRHPPVTLERTRDTGLRHENGTLSMARGSPDSARSDFFICIGPQPSLDFGGARNGDGQGFAAFGRVVMGMDVVRKIHAAPTNGERLTPPITIRKARRR